MYKFRNFSLIIFSLLWFILNTVNSATYRKTIMAMPINLSPHSLEDSISQNIMNQIGEGLITYEGNSISPGLAESWAISADRKKYKFQLRSDVYFSDGRKITTKHALHALKNLLTKDSLSSQELLLIKGAKEYRYKRTTNVSGIKIISNSIIEIEIKRPYPPFLSILASTQFSILPKNEIESLRKNKIQKVVSSGPYFIKKIKNNELIVLAKNQYYYKKDFVYFDIIEYHVERNKEKAIKGFLDGKYQDIWPYFLKLKKYNQKEDQIKRIPSYSAMSWYLQFNLTSNKFSDKSF